MPPRSRIPLSTAPINRTFQARSVMATSGSSTLRQAFALSLSEAGEALTRQVELFGRALADGLDPDAFLRAHEGIGAAAQRSVLSSYGQRVTRKQGPSGYRAGATDNHSRRFAGGALRRALGSKDFYRATADGLQFVNIRTLDKEAAHWYRLNFGAGAAGLGSTARFQVRWHGLVVASLGFDAEPSAPFAMPRGVWVSPTGERVRAGANPAGTDEFYPQGERPPGIRGAPTSGTMTRGIEARNFLDAGLRRIADLLPRAYDDIYRDWFNQARRKVPTGPFAQSRISVPRPTVGAMRPRRVTGLNF